MDKSRQVDKSIRDINDGIKGIRPRSQSSFQGLTSQARSRNSFLHNICHLPTPSVPSVPSAIFHHHHLGPPWTALDRLGPPWTITLPRLSSGAASGRSVNSQKLCQEMAAMHSADRTALVGTHLRQVIHLNRYRHWPHWTI